jgi:hypothetical protein
MYADEILKKKGGLFSVKVELNGAFDKGEEAEAHSMMTQDNGDSHYIVLREFNSAEMLEFQGLDSGSATRELEKKLPDFMVEHSFRNQDNSITSNGDVLKIIRLSSSLLVWILEEWQGKLPLTRRTLRASAGQRPSSSKAEK